MLHFPYKSTRRSSDCDETVRNCCKHARGGFGNLKKLKIVLAGVSGVALSLQEHTFFIRLRCNFQKLLLTCSRWYWKFNLYIKINVCVCVPYRSTRRSSDCDETFTSCCKHYRGGFGNLKNLLAGVPDVALSLQEHAPLIRLR